MSEATVGRRIRIEHWRYWAPWALGNAIGLRSPLGIGTHAVRACGRWSPSRSRREENAEGVGELASGAADKVDVPVPCLEEPGLVGDGGHGACAC